MLQTLRPLAPILCAAMLTAAPALAQDAPCVLPYETFEYSVPHTDMETCPASMPVEDAFCRAALMVEVLTIYAFATETSCLIAAKAYEEDGFALRVE